MKGDRLCHFSNNLEYISRSPTRRQIMLFLSIYSRSVKRTFNQIMKWNGKTCQMTDRTNISGTYTHRSAATDLVKEEMSRKGKEKKITIWRKWKEGSESITDKLRVTQAAELKPRPPHCNGQPAIKHSGEEEGWNSTWIWHYFCGFPLSHHPHARPSSSSGRHLRLICIRGIIQWHVMALILILPFN